ncbi:MAG: uracil-DNA glycosylase family protein [Candidatus Saccharimonadales bacterium]
MASSIDTQMFDQLVSEIMNHPSNKEYGKLGLKPLFTASPNSKIVIVGQAPGKKAQESGVVWNDASGERLISWLGINEETFRDPTTISHLPMDFYYPGKGKSGDLPPRPDFAKLWHEEIMKHMPAIELILLIGQYSQKYYLGKSRSYNLTETVRNYNLYLPKYFPLVHPSPLNFRWFNNNRWYEKEVIPNLKTRVSQILRT